MIDWCLVVFNLCLIVCVDCFAAFYGVFTCLVVASVAFIPCYYIVLVWFGCVVC